MSMLVVAVAPWRGLVVRSVEPPVVPVSRDVDEFPEIRAIVVPSPVSNPDDILDFIANLDGSLN